MNWGGEASRALGGWQKSPQEPQGGGRDPLESPGPRGTARAGTYRHLVHRGGSAAVSLVAGPVQGVLLPAGGRTQSIKTGGNRGGFGVGGSRGCAHREPAGCGGTGYREPGTPGASGRDMGTGGDLEGPGGTGGVRGDREGPEGGSSTGGVVGRWKRKAPLLFLFLPRARIMALPRILRAGEGSGGAKPS